MVDTSSVKMIEFYIPLIKKFKCWQNAQDLTLRDLNWLLFKTVNTEAY